MRAMLDDFGKSLKHKEIYFDNLKIIDVTSAEDLISDGQRALYEYFNSKTNNERLAKRDDLNPEEIKPYLPNIGMVDVVRNDNGDLEDLIVRLLGTALVTFYGEITGKLLSTFRDPVAAQRVITSVKCIDKTSRPLVYISTGNKEDFKRIETQMLFIPLSNGKEIEQMFCFIEVKPFGYDQ